MEVSKGKISIRQGIILFALILGAPSLRVVPNYVSRTAERASWISPFLVVIPSIILVFVLARLFKNKSGSLYDIYEDIFGKIINKIITVVYVAWCIFLASFYMRMFAERFVETILFDTSIVGIIVLMALFVLFIVNQKIDVLGRMAEILIFLFGSIIVVVFFVIFRDIKLENLWPITHFNLVPALKGTVPLFSLISYITALMFLGDKISNKKAIKKTGIIGVISIAVFSLLIILSTIGLMGYKLNSQFLFPYFTTLKNIQIMGSIERVESLVISTWVGADCAIVSFFTLIALTLIRRQFNCKSHKKFSVWIIAIIVIVSIMFAPNLYAAKKIDLEIVGNVNVILFAIVPIIALCVGKIRKVI